MDTYMIKKEDGNIHHFRAKVGEHWVSVTLLASEPPSIYNAEGLWLNYNKLKAVLDRRYEEYKSK